MNLETSQKKQLMDAVETFNRIENEGGLETLQKMETLMENADRIENCWPSEE